MAVTRSNWSDLVVRLTQSAPSSSEGVPKNKIPDGPSKIGFALPPEGIRPHVFESLQTLLSRGGLQKDRYEEALKVFQDCPFAEPLFEIIAEGAAPSANGYPTISQNNFQRFREKVPHTYQAGLALLTWLAALEVLLSNQNGLGADKLQSMKNAILLFRRMVFTAAITSPPIHWGLRQIISAHHQLGTIAYLASGNELIISEYAENRSLQGFFLEQDMKLLYSRGFLVRTEQGYTLAQGPAGAVLSQVGKLSPNLERDITRDLVTYFQGQALADQKRRINQWLEHRIKADPIPGKDSAGDIDLGYHGVSLLLALNKVHPPRLDPSMTKIFEEMGLMKDGQVTLIGQRVFKNGPGPAGIIQAYHDYTHQWPQLLAKRGRRPKMDREDNIAASKDANRATFRATSRQIVKFSRDFDHQPMVLIEHAAGFAIGLQEYLEESPIRDIQLVAADYEMRALNYGVVAEIAADRLPKSTKWLQADIGNPRTLLDFLSSKKIPTEGAVMLVGGGFHEAKKRVGETDPEFDQRLIRVFKEYAEAGMILAFDESSDFTDDELLAAGNETFHPIFRWAHEISGQNLRAPWPKAGLPRMSWSEILEKSEYEWLPEYSVFGRTLLPVDLPSRQNPPHRITYFAVSRALLAKLKNSPPQTSIGEAKPEFRLDANQPYSMVGSDAIINSPKALSVFSSDGLARKAAPSVAIPNHNGILRFVKPMDQEAKTSHITHSQMKQLSGMRPNPFARSMRTHPFKRFLKF